MMTSIKKATAKLLALALGLCLLQMPIYAQTEQAVTFPELAGKTVSILGDSLTAYIGTASNGTQDTSHTYKFKESQGTYPNERSGITSINQMFYGKFFEQNNMQLHVNNSIGGTGVTINYTPVLNQNITFLGGTEEQNRILGLWKYDENNNRVDPDIILISGSGNDFDLAPLGEWDGDIEALDETAHPTTFKAAYAVMLKRMSAEYPNADIWCITLQSFSDVISNPATQYPDKNEFGDTLLTYNQGIRDVAAAFGAYVLDLEVSVTPEQYNTHKYDNIHPNLLGHEAMYQQMVKDFSKVYSTELETPLLGNVDGDNTVGIGDLVAIASSEMYNNIVAAAHACDVNSDGKINFADLAMVRNSKNFGNAKE